MSLAAIVTAIRFVLFTTTLYRPSHSTECSQKAWIELKIVTESLFCKVRVIDFDGDGYPDLLFGRESLKTREMYIQI